MKESSEIKEKIINVTKELIEKSDGSIDAITIRAISEKAGVGTGLINYHFQTKENLIELCVQSLIGEVISGFKPTLDNNSDPVEKTKTVAKQVMDVLMSKPSVSRISILGDHSRPQIFDNTMKTAMGFSNYLSDLEISEETKKILVFGFVSVLQGVFLRRELSKELFGFDLNIKEDRDSYIDLIADNMFGGMIR